MRPTKRPTRQIHQTYPYASNKYKHTHTNTHTREDDDDDGNEDVSGDVNLHFFRRVRGDSLDIFSCSCCFCIFSFKFCWYSVTGDYCCCCCWRRRWWCYLWLILYLNRLFFCLTNIHHPLRCSIHFDEHLVTILKKSIQATPDPSNQPTNEPNNNQNQPTSQPALPASRQSSKTKTYTQQ